MSIKMFFSFKKKKNIYIYILLLLLLFITLFYFPFSFFVCFVLFCFFFFCISLNFVSWFQYPIPTLLSVLKVILMYCKLIFNSMRQTTARLK